MVLVPWLPRSRAKWPLARSSLVQSELSGVVFAWLLDMCQPALAIEPTTLPTGGIVVGGNLGGLVGEHLRGSQQSYNFS